MLYDGPEGIKRIGNTLYAYYVNGAGPSKLTLTLIEKSLKVKGKGRNWNTLTKLLELSANNKEGQYATRHEPV
jgi:uncharacterized protein (DUF1697 family)